MLSDQQLSSKIDDLSHFDADKILEKLAEYKKLQRERKKKFISFPKPTTQIIGKTHQTCITSSEAAKHIVGNILEDIDKKSLPNIKSALVEAFEWLALSEKSAIERKRLRTRLCRWIMIEDQKELAKAVCSFAVAINEKW